MSDLASLDLEIRPGAAAAPDEERFEIRRVSCDEFIAWFETNIRMSDGVPVASVSLQFVRREALTDEQVTAVIRRLIKKAGIALR